MTKTDRPLTDLQRAALDVVRHGGVTRLQIALFDAPHWRDSNFRTINGRTMDSLLNRKLIELHRDRTRPAQPGRRLVAITRDGRIALGLPAVDLDEAKMRLGLYLIQHAIRASGGQQVVPHDVVHEIVRTENGREVSEQLRVSDVERILDALDGHL